jgi:DNA polymerase-3 subunit alpha
MTVELDRRPGDEVPRVTVKHFQPIDGLAKKTRLQLDLLLNDSAALAAMIAQLATSRGGNGLIRATLPVSGGREATLVLGRDFVLDADLAARLDRLLGTGAVNLSAQEGPKLALVG